MNISRRRPFTTAWSIMRSARPSSRRSNSAPKENKSYVASVSQGITFLGFRVYPGVLRLSRPALTRVRRSIAQRERACAEGRISEAERAQSVGSLLANKVPEMT